MPMQPIIVSTVGQALDGTTDNDLLDVIRKASIELNDILVFFDQKDACIQIVKEQIQSAKTLGFQEIQENQTFPN